MRRIWKRTQGWTRGLSPAGVSLLLLCTCSSSATLTMRDGTTYKGRILRSADPRYVWLDGREGAGAVRRADVAEVTHPGTAELITAGVFAGFGALSFYDAATCGNSAGEVRDCGGASQVFGTAFAITAVILGIDGIATHLGSRERYAASAKPSPVWSPGWNPLRLPPLPPSASPAVVPPAAAGPLSPPSASSDQPDAGLPPLSAGEPADAGDTDRK